MNEDVLCEKQGFEMLGFTFGYDSHGGTFYWGTDKIQVYATPGYEDVKGVPIEVSNEDGLIECDQVDIIPKDWNEYLEIVKPFLEKYKNEEE